MSKITQRVSALIQYMLPPVVGYKIVVPQGAIIWQSLASFAGFSAINNSQLFVNTSSKYWNKIGTNVTSVLTVGKLHCILHKANIIFIIGPSPEMIAIGEYSQSAYFTLYNSASVPEKHHDNSLYAKSCFVYDTSFSYPIDNFRLSKKTLYDQYMPPIETLDIKSWIKNSYNRIFEENLHQTRRVLQTIDYNTL